MMYDQFLRYISNARNVFALTETKGSGNFTMLRDAPFTDRMHSVTDLIIQNRDPSFQGVV